MNIHPFKLCLVFFSIALLAFGGSSGPKHGALVIVGGGAVGPEITQRFFELAGGKDAPIVVIPTAAADGEIKPELPDISFLKKAGASHITLLHTRDRTAADSEEFVAPIKQARAAWIPGGRHWRLADSYLHTRTQRELQALLNRGGVVGGTSAGATVMGSYMVRGAREGNQIMMAKGYEEGFGFLRNVTIDQHLLTRHRENDLTGVIKVHPELLGIGIDESTAIVVQGNTFEVLGSSQVAIYDGKRPFYFLSAGDRFDIKKKKKMTGSLTVAAR